MGTWSTELLLLLMPAARPSFICVNYTPLVILLRLSSAQHLLLQLLLTLKAFLLRECRGVSTLESHHGYTKNET